MKNYIKYPLVVFLVGFLISEIAFRTFYHRELTIGRMEDAIFADDSVLFYVYKPNFDFKVGNKIVHTNKDGYIGEDFGEKTENKFRIAFVGSCGVAGSLHQPEYYSFCPILQQLFTQANSQVEILNCGIDGDYRSLELFKSIDYKVKKNSILI